MDGTLSRTVLYQEGSVHLSVWYVLSSLFLYSPHGGVHRVSLCLSVTLYPNFLHWFFCLFCLWRFILIFSSGLSVCLPVTFYPHFFEWFAVCLSVTSYPHLHKLQLSNNIQSELSTGGAKRDVEKTPKCTPKLYPGPTISSWPAQGLVILCVNFSKTIEIFHMQ